MNFVLITKKLINSHNAGGSPAMDWHPIQGGVEIFLVASCHGNRDKLRPDGPLGSIPNKSLGLITNLRAQSKPLHRANRERQALSSDKERVDQPPCLFTHD